MPLTELAIKNTKPAVKTFKLFDSHGLYLEVVPTGGKLWRFKYRFAGKEKRLALGAYPIISLKEARLKRDEAKRLLAGQIDPGIHRKLSKLNVSGQNSLQSVALEWLSRFCGDWSASHLDKTKRRLERDLFPWLGQKAVNQITVPELLAVLRRIENRGSLETAHRLLQNCGQIFRYAIATGRADKDIALDLRGALPPVKSKHYATILEPQAIGALLRTIDEYQGYFPIACALRLAPLLFVRPGELRQTQWNEIDWEKACLRIPAERMKMRIQHIVPLSRQALEILEELRPCTGQGTYLFPSPRTTIRPISNNTLNAALRRLGYGKEEITSHGFRSMASTLLNEMGFNRDWIERQLAHGESNTIRAAYNYAEYLPERTNMMQAWADYLDGLRAEASLPAV